MPLASPRMALAQAIFEPDLYDYQYQTANGLDQIVANPNDEGRNAGFGQVQMVREEIILSDGSVDPDTTLYVDSSGASSVYVDNCSSAATLFSVDVNDFSINVTGSPNHFPCNDGGGGGGPAPGIDTGSIEVTLFVRNLDDLLEGRAVGPLDFAVVDNTGASITRSSNAVIEQGTAVDLNEITHSIGGVPVGNDYKIIVSEGERRVASSAAFDVKKSERSDIRIDINLGQFTGGEDAEEGTPRCESTNALAYILCPVATGLFLFLEFLYENVVLDNLKIDPLSDSKQGGPEEIVFNIWNNFRIIANVLFVLFFMVAIFGQTFSIYFTAYELKKILPRLVFGIIAVQLSWFIVGTLVDVFNIIGAGVRGIMLAPVDGFNAFEAQAEESGAALIGGILTAGITYFVGGSVTGGGALAVKALTFILPPILFTLVVGVLLAILTLVFRRMLIFLLIIFAPIALVAWVLPGTDKLTKMWWSYLTKALMMYPIIVALIAAGLLTGKLLIAGDDTPFQFRLAGFITVFAPYFLIPQTFKFAGGVIANVAGGFDNMRTRGHQKLFGDVQNPFSFRGRRRAYFGKMGGQAKHRLLHAANGPRRTPLRGLARAYARVGGAGLAQHWGHEVKAGAEHASKTLSVDPNLSFAIIGGMSRGNNRNLWNGSLVGQPVLNEAQKYQDNHAYVAGHLASLLGAANDPYEVAAIVKTFASNSKLSHHDQATIWKAVTENEKLVKGTHGYIKYVDFEDLANAYNPSMPGGVDLSMIHPDGYGKASALVEKYGGTESNYVRDRMKGPVWTVMAGAFHTVAEQQTLAPEDRSIDINSPEYRAHATAANQFYAAFEHEVIQDKLRTVNSVGNGLPSGYLDSAAQSLGYTSFNDLSGRYRDVTSAENGANVSISDERHVMNLDRVLDQAWEDHMKDNNRVGGGRYQDFDEYAIMRSFSQRDPNAGQDAYRFYSSIKGDGTTVRRILL